MSLGPRKVDPAFARAALARLLREAGIPDPKLNEIPALVPHAVPHPRVKLVYSGWFTVDPSTSVIVPEVFDGVIPMGDYNRTRKTKDPPVLEGWLFGRIQISHGSPKMGVQIKAEPSFTPDAGFDNRRDANEGNAPNVLAPEGGNQQSSWNDFPLPITPWRMILKNNNTSGSGNRVAIVLVYHNVPMFLELSKSAPPRIIN